MMVSLQLQLPITLPLRSVEWTVSIWYSTTHTMPVIVLCSLIYRVIGATDET